MGYRQPSVTRRGGSRSGDGHRPRYRDQRRADVGGTVQAAAVGQRYQRLHAATGRVAGNPAAPPGDGNRRRTRRRHRLPGAAAAAVQRAAFHRVGSSARTGVVSVHIDVVADGLGFPEGPVWLPDGRVALTSISHGCVYVVDPSGDPHERIETGGGPNGLACSADGTLYVAQNGGAWGASGLAEAGVQVISGTRVDYLVEGLGAPNDLTFGPDGRLWITDTRGEFDMSAPEAGPPGHVYASNVESGETQQIIDDGPVFINGLGFDYGGSTLLVTATLSSQLLSYAIAAPDYRPIGTPELLPTFAEGW